ncbi:cation:dicarboxylate symporter family transporter, partial [Pseudomonas sp. EA_65y_Pfl1_P113]
MSATLNSPSTRILVSLGAGLLLGIAFATWLPGAVPGATAVAQPIGSAWLNALQMTVIPLVFSLLVTGIASTAEAARSGAVAARAISIILVVMV